MYVENFLKQNPQVQKALEETIKIEDITEIILMAKGSTNISYIINTKDKRYVLRVPGAGTDNIINRHNEYMIYSLLKNHGICDNTIYLNPDNGIKITEFYENSHHLNVNDENDLRIFVDTVRKFHELKLDFPETYDFFENIELYEKEKNKPSRFEDYEEVRKDIFSLKAFTDSQKDSYVLIHNDLSPENCLIAKDSDGREKCILIDFEYSAKQSPMADIAYFCVFANLDEQQTDKLIDMYFDGNTPDEMRALVYAYIAANGLIHTNWMEYKENYGKEYTKEIQDAYNMTKLYYRKARNLLDGKVI